MATANIAEVSKLAAKPVQHDNDEKTWLEFRFKLENYLTLVDERYVALLLNAESQRVANLPTGCKKSAEQKRFEAWRQLAMNDNPPKFEETCKSWEHRVSTETARPSAGELSTV